MPSDSKTVDELKGEIRAELDAMRQRLGPGPADDEMCRCEKPDDCVLGKPAGHLRCEVGEIKAFYQQLIKDAIADMTPLERLVYLTSELCKQLEILAGPEDDDEDEDEDDDEEADV